MIVVISSGECGPHHHLNILIIITPKLQLWPDFAIIQPERRLNSIIYRWRPYLSFTC